MSTDKDKQQTILIVDDEPLNIRVFSSIVQEDYVVQTATSGARALEITSKLDQPDLILLDILMPEMDGYEVCQRLKKDKKTFAIPIIFITSKTSILDEEYGFSLGAADYITKPFQPSVVLARITNQMERRLAEKSLKNKINELEQALETIKALEDILPICSGCKKIRDDKGYWQQVEKYFYEHLKTRFSHGMCPDCMKEFYPEGDTANNKAKK